jgi:hypothetical protein
MDQWIGSCNDSRSYPLNLIHHDALEHSIRAYQARLAAQAEDLFDQDIAALDFFELHDSNPGICFTRPVTRFRKVVAYIVTP